MVVCRLMGRNVQRWHRSEVVAILHISHGQRTGQVRHCHGVETLHGEDGRGRSTRRDARTRRSSSKFDRRDGSRPLAIEWNRSRERKSGRGGNRGCFSCLSVSDLFSKQLRVRFFSANRRSFRRRILVYRQYIKPIAEKRRRESVQSSGETGR